MEDIESMLLAKGFGDEPIPSSFAGVDIDALKLRLLDTAAVDQIVQMGVSPLDVSQLVSFLHRFVHASLRGFIVEGEEEQQNKDHDLQAKAKWDLSRANQLERDFFRAAEQRLMMHLQFASIAIGRQYDDDDKQKQKQMQKDDDDCTLVLYRRGIRMTVGQVCDCASDLLQLFQSNVVDFKAIIEASIAGSGAVIADGLPFLADKQVKKELAQVKCVPTAVSGEDFMVEFEVAFQADMANKTIAFPDLNVLPQTHVNEMLRIFRLQDPCALRRHFLHLCLRVPCHELIHCVQGLAKQVDNDPMSWSAEHDASYACHSIFYAMCNREQLSEICVPGTVEENLMLALDTYAWATSQWSPQVKEQYHIWRDSFGLKAPDKDVVNDVQDISVFKGLLAMELGSSDPKVLQAQLRALFKDREGDVYKAGKPKLPECLQVQPKEDILASLLH